MSPRNLPDEVLLERHSDLLRARNQLEKQIRAVHRVISDRGLVRTRSAKHGTDGGYYAHLRRWKTEPCAPCRKAHAAAEAARKLRRQM